MVVLKVTDSSGRVLYQHPSDAARAVADPNLTYLITHILSDDEARAPTYGRNSPLKLSRPAAAKTGTTDDFRDSWIVGYTPDLLTGVWVGNSDGRPMRDVVGARGAGRIYNQFMEAALAGVPTRAFSRPAGIVEREVCSLSGLLPSAECPERVTELFAPNNVPTRQDDFFKRAEICLVNGRLANEHVPANARESRLFVTFPEPYSAWAAQNGYAPPPTERCDDVYRGIKRAELADPRPDQQIRGSIQIVGTALMDDLDHYDLEFGEGPRPQRWSGITMGRHQGVDNALLGVWNSATAQPGQYTLRLSLYDSLGNKHESQTRVVVAASETPTPSSRSTPGATATPRSTAGVAGTPTPTPARPATVPTPTPVRR